MNRFGREWAAIPGTARWLAALGPLALLGLLEGIVLVPGVARGSIALSEALVLSVIAVAWAVILVIYLLLVGYVWGDAKRRAMNHVLWTLLAIFVPYAIGIILYFILRDPLRAPCPSCGTLPGKDDAYCTSCGAAVRSVCPGCGRPVESAWRNCAHCGAPLKAVTQEAPA